MKFSYSLFNEELKRSLIRGYVHGMGARFISIIHGIMDGCIRGEQLSIFPVSGLQGLKLHRRMLMLSSIDALYFEPSEMSESSYFLWNSHAAA